MQTARRVIPYHVTSNSCWPVLPLLIDWLDICWPVVSNCFLHHFPYLFCFIPLLLIKLSLTQPKKFLTFALLILSSIPLGLGSKWEAVCGWDACRGYMMTDAHTSLSGVGRIIRFFVSSAYFICCDRINDKYYFIVYLQKKNMSKKLSNYRYKTDSIQSKPWYVQLYLWD